MMEILTFPGLNPINWNNPPDADKRVASTLICGNGDRFTGSFRTVAHMASMMDDLDREHPSCTLHVIQPPYNTDNPSSAGSHDKDCASDTVIFGMDFPKAQRWFRSKGFDCWWRHTGTWASPSQWHIHGFPHPLGGQKFATTVGVLLDGGVSQFGHRVSSSQLDDYNHQAFGLENQHVPGSDNSWFPNKPYPVFNLNAYVRTKQEENMEYKDWSKESKDELAERISRIVANSNRDLLATKVVARNNTNDGVTKITVRQAIVRAANAIVFSRDKSADIVDLLNRADEEANAEE